MTERLELELSVAELDCIDEAQPIQGALRRLDGVVDKSWANASGWWSPSLTAFQRGWRLPPFSPGGYPIFRNVVRALRNRSVTSHALLHAPGRLHRKVWGVWGVGMMIMMLVNALPVKSHLSATGNPGLRVPWSGRIVGWLLAVGALIGLPLLDSGVASGQMGPMMKSTRPEQIQEVILRVKPSVVLISVKVQGEATVWCGERSANTVSLPTRGETGTGFVIHPDGYVATNAHVVGLVDGTLSTQELKGLGREAVVAACGADLAAFPPPTRETRIEALMQRPENRRGLRVARQVQVVFQDGRTLEARVLASNPPVLQAQRERTKSAGEVPDDVAILKVERRNLLAAPLGQVMAQIGDQLFVIGFPGVVLTHEMLSTRSRVAPSVTLGRVSGFKLDLGDQDVVQTDAAITWGNSGGPAFNTRGDVIGVATFLSVGREGTEVQGFNFLIPVGRVATLASTIRVVPTADTAIGRQWAAAVGAFFAERYDAAIGALQEILRADPTFPDARRLLAAAQARPARESAAWGRWMGEMIQGGGMSSSDRSHPGDPVDSGPARPK